jgi:hypothetical protein
MFETLEKRLRQWSDLRPPIDPRQLDDPIAVQTSWVPIQKVSANIFNRVMRLAEPHRLEYRPSNMAYAGSLFFVALGACVLLFVPKSEFLILNLLTWALAGMHFAVGIAALGENETEPMVFDLRQGFFIRGHGKDAPAFHAAPSKKSVPLNTIHAIQLLTDTDDEGDKTFQVNLVLKSADRIRLVNQLELAVTRKHAKMLAEFLRVQLWDVAG